jgi:hypothetical protein
LEDKPFGIGIFSLKPQMQTLAFVVFCCEKFMRKAEVTSDNRIRRWLMKGAPEPKVRTKKRERTRNILGGR